MKKIFFSIVMSAMFFTISAQTSGSTEKVTINRDAWEYVIDQLIEAIENAPDPDPGSNVIEVDLSNADATLSDFMEFDDFPEPDVPEPELPEPEPNVPEPELPESEPKVPDPKSNK